MIPDYKKILLVTISLFLFIPLYSQSYNPYIYKERRLKFISKMEENSLAVFESSEVKGRNSDNDYEYKQDATFQYLCGIIEPNAYLIIFKPAAKLNGKKIDEILFVKDKDPFEEQWTGEILGQQKATLISHADTVFSSTAFLETFKQYAMERIVLYLGQSDYSMKKDPVTGVRYNFYEDRKKKLRIDYPNLELKSLFDIISDMREIKSKDELENIDKAIEATTAGCIEAMKSCEPEMYEYQLEAVIEYAYKIMGCDYYAFPSIIGSGPNSLVLHYENNNRRMLSGELVLMDIGAEFNGYAADISRTIPVNGKFTKEQRDIYNVVLKAQLETIKIMHPGTKPEDIEMKSLDLIAEGLLNLGILKNKKDARKFMPHGVSHNMGLDVHDVYTSMPLREGQILTIEPGIYIPVDSKDISKKYRGIGIRIEDDILITRNGNIVLSEKAPKNIEEIEKIMAETGIGNIEPGKYKK